MVSETKTLLPAFDAAMLQDPRTWPEGLYVHLPFCAALCTYCDFASEVYAAARARRYLDVLDAEFARRVRPLEALGKRFSPRTIFLGGGTPSALNIPELERFFEMLRRHVDLARVAEFTIEANPGSTDGAKLEFLRAQGVNRISFGVQSFQPHLLRLLGRIHGADQGREAVRLARAAGFGSISIDLMHGLPRQTMEDLKSDLDEALTLGTDHVSAYGLIYEDGTPLTEAVRASKVQPLTPEEEAEHYLLVMETLERGGLPQYEISNYARPGHEAQHNIIYWRNEAYLGVGVSAASFIGWERTVNQVAMDAYMNAAPEGELFQSREILAPEARAREAFVLAMRLRTGVNPARFAELWGVDVLNSTPAFPRLHQVGLLEEVGGAWRISRRGMPVADGILAEFV